MSRILLVDDLAIVRELVRNALVAHGHEVNTASTGDEALRRIVCDPPELVLLDLAMPGMDGTALLRRLRKRESTRTLPVIVLTQATSKSDVLQMRKIGVTDYLLKREFSLPDLLDRIQTALDDRPASNQRVDELESQPDSDTSSQLEEHPTRTVDQARVTSTPQGQTHATAPLTDLKPIIRRSEVQEALDTYSQVMAFSPSVSRILAMAGREDCSIETLARLIRRDPGVSLKVLQVANSPLYDRGTPVETVEKAILRMGTNATRHAVLSLSVVERFAEDPSLTAYLEAGPFWEHSIATGLLSAAITRARADEDDPEMNDAIASAFTMGLLHDVGQLIYLQALGDRYLEVLDTADQLNAPLHKVESRLLLINHAEAMDRVLHSWNFPAALINPIAFHHMPVADARRLCRATADASSVLALANRLAHALALGHSADTMVYPLTDHLAALNMPHTAIDELCASVPDATSEMKLSMLSCAAGGHWADDPDALVDRLPDNTRCAYIGMDESPDPVQLFCASLANSTDEEPPNLAIVHLAHGKDIPELTEKLLAADTGCSIRPCPAIIVSSNSQLQLEGRVEDGRSTRYLPLPFTTKSFLKAVEELLGADPAAAA